MLEENSVVVAGILQELAQSSDAGLFKSICSNPDQVLRDSLTDKKPSGHNLHPMAHSFALPTKRPETLCLLHFVELWCSTVKISLFIHSRSFYSASSSTLLLRGAPNYSTNTVLKLTCRSATGICGWKTCQRSLHAGYWTCNLQDARHRTYHRATTSHISVQLSLTIYASLILYYL